MQPQIQVAIIGGGLAGLTAAIHLIQKGYKVTVFEKNVFPKHKVCGEFISNEVVPYWKQLGINLQDLKPTTITNTIISIPSGKKLEANLPLGGFGISRFTLDHYLSNQVVQLGGTIIQTNIEQITFQNNHFLLIDNSGKIYSSLIALGCFGKRSNLDVHLKRDFIQKKITMVSCKSTLFGKFSQ